MRLKPKIAITVGVLLFACALVLWRYGIQHRARNINSASGPVARLAQHPPLIKTAATNAIPAHKSYRITNTHQSFAKLLHNPHAIILRNALIDTEVPVALKIPDHLRAKGAPGSYLVQSDRPLDNGFYAELRKEGASYVSYIPNNAALVKATPEAATNLAALPDIVAVLPYQPYYKLDSTLLPNAVEQQPETNQLSITVFPGQRDAALAELVQLGASLVGEDRSPFGPTLVVNIPSNSLVAVAQMPLAQEIEAYTPRHKANDLTRVIMNVAVDTSSNTPNYLNLTGSNVTVNLNDTGVDATHPDFTPTNRLIGDFPASLFDPDGHGTHVAGIIAGNGKESGTVTNLPPGSVAGASFRGKATNATLFVQSLDLVFGPFISDAFLQQNASTNLGPTNLISNNSWGYGSTVYDTHAASYDAATRDAQPNVDGEQPLLFVFAAGNSGNGSGNGIDGESGTINSPATAKNVITVGASDSPRFLTNLVSFDGITTNEAFYDETDNTNLVAPFSSCGNVSLGTEGAYGRFKPDVVAPGVFIVSCRSSNYIDPTNATFLTEYPFLGQTVDPNTTNTDNGGYAFFLPPDTSRFTAVITSNLNSPIPFPTNMFILADTNFPPAVIVSSNNIYNLTNWNTNDLYYFGVAPPTNSPGPVNYDITFYLFETNSEGDYFTVLSNMNSGLRPYYRYETGTSMSAGAVSGFLALMQEFLQQDMGITNPSPALMKAMLINGSRSLGLQYDFNVNTQGANEQGWGLPSLPDVLPPSLTNGNPSMILVDQSTNRAMATGQYQTYTINCTDTNATNFPLRVSLVWTDPPGNPAAGITLVNNLELTVADASGSNIYVGNNFLSGMIYTQSSTPTNLPVGQSDNDVQNVYVNQNTASFTSAGDVINNVQNVYISPSNSIAFPLTITVSATRVNVNAVTTQTNNVLQDYALVVSSDDPSLSAPLTIVTNAITSTNAPLITIASNAVPLLHQRVGANEPNLYNFTTGSTNGAPIQWHFFIFTNSELVVSNTTNVAFATFLPPNLSIPRATGSADIDLYVYTNAISDFSGFIEAPGGMDAFASGAVKSVGRTGNESIVFTNSTVPVYYVGVKSEDQQASDFGFYAVAQQQPFSTSSADGQSITATGTALPVAIPDDTSPTPALVFAFMVNPNPVLNMIRRTTVTLGIQYPTVEDLVGTLQFNDVSTVLNSYSSVAAGSGFTNTFDDLQEDPNSGDILSAGPGSLAQYIGMQATGMWLLTESSQARGEGGNINQYTVSVDLQQPQTTGFFVTIPGQSWFDDYVDVPNDATNMTIYTLYESEGTNNGSTGPIGIYLTNEVGEITFSDYGSNNISPPGGSLSLSTNNPVPGWPGAPPLAGGYWYYGIYNYSSQPVTLYVQIVFQESLTPNLVQTYTNNEFIPLTTDGHTQSQICISNGQQLVDLQVGLRINDTNLDDLVIHLTSPEGTSVLLFEDRGGTNADALGLSLLATNGTTNLATNFVYTIFTEDTNLADTPIKFAPPPYASNEVTAQANLYSTSFEDVTNGTYTNGAILDGWLVTNTIVDVYSNGTVSLQTNDTVGIVTDPAGEIYGATNLGSNYLALTSGRIVQTFGVTNTFAVTNGQPYELVFYAKPMGVTNWWPANGNTDDLISGDTGTIPYNDVTYSQGEYDKAFTFSGKGQSPDFNTGNEVDFGTNTGNFGTNDYTIDFWARVPAGQTGLYGVMEKRMECGPWYSYFDIHFGYESGDAPTTNGAFFFDNAGIGTGSSFANFCQVISTNQINDGKYHHAAFVRHQTNLSIYIDGLLRASGSGSGVANITNNVPLRIGNSECVSPGVGATDASQPFQGELDEIDIVNRALSPAEIYGIYHAGVLGKYNTNSILPNFNLTIDGVETNNIVLSNSAGGWELFTNSFTATNNTITVEFAGNPMGVLLDDIQLIQLPATNYANYYLPEEPITPFIGENPLGCWTLDVWDTRQDSPLPTNGELLSWTLQLTTSSTNAMLYVLTNGQPYNVTNASSNSITYFAIDVPSYATFATNILTANSGNSVTLFFDQNALPTGGLPGDYTLAPNVAIGTSSTNTLSTVGLPPPLIPGRRYFLGVLDNGAGNANFTIEVNFNGSTNEIIPLTNEIPYTNIVSTNIIGTNGPEYYSFVAPTNAIMVTFQILNPSNGEVDLYAREGLPVPGPSLFDYASANSGTNDQFIVVTTNSLPVTLPVWTNILPVPKPTTWYLAAYNPAGVSNITYSIVASFVTNTTPATNVTGNSEMTIIALSNAVPYTNTALPGYPTNLLYSFTVTNNPSGVEFTVTNLTNVGNVQLLADINGFPTPQDPYAGSFNVGVTNQIIQIVPSANLPSLNGTWYLSVPNTSNTNVLYSIEALTNFIVAPPLTALTWSGAVDDVWDILATSNWVATSNMSLPYPYQNASALTFDDSAVGPTTINIEEAVTPGSVAFNNNILAYTFNGAGGISGAPLTMNGTEPVTLDNSGANVFSSVSIGGGILQIGNNDTNGSLGPTAVVDTGTGSLIFDRTDNFTVSNVISDNGSLSQLGSGVLTLAGVNSYTGGTTISNGTIIVDNTNALGSGTGDFAPVIIENGGTLDLGGIPTSYGPTSPLFDGMFFKISGAGANGAGAIVNNGTNAQLGGLEVIELTTGNASIGGSARWDIRNNAATVKLGGFSLTKTGTNQINMASTSVNLGNIIVAEGILSFEGTPNFRFDPSGTYAITVEPGGLLGGNLDALGSFTRAIVLAGGGFTNLSGSNTSYLDASITLTNNSWLGNGAGYEIFDGIISGSAALTNLGTGTNVFAATNTYTGATYIAQGTLELTNNGSISNSATILVSSGALLDASERVDQTLTLGTNQTLINNGLVAGNTVAGAGSTVLGTGNFTGNLTTGAGSILSPGPSLTTIGSLTGNTTITLGAGSTTVMKLNKALAPGQTNDILVASNLFLGGTLVVTNYDNVDPFVAGDSFRIFSAANTAGTFGANLILPPLPPGLAWTNNFAGQGGTITVVNQSAASGPGVRMSITLSGSNIIFTGTNGTPFGQYVILTSTDMTAPLSTWTPVATNFFDSNGDFSMTIAVSNVAAQFYILQSQ